MDNQQEAKQPPYPYSVKCQYCQRGLAHSVKDHQQMETAYDKVKNPDHSSGPQPANPNYQCSQEEYADFKRRHNLDD